MSAAPQPLPEEASLSQWFLNHWAGLLTRKHHRSLSMYGSCEAGAMPGSSAPAHASPSHSEHSHLVRLSKRHKPDGSGSRGRSTQGEPAEDSHIPETGGSDSGLHTGSGRKVRSALLGPLLECRPCKHPECRPCKHLNP